MNEQIELIDNLRRLASALPREASPAVEQKLMTAFRERRPRKIAVWAYAAAACAVLAAALVLTHKPARPPRTLDVYLPSGFVALPYSQSGVPMESAIVIRVRIRPAELSSMGVAVPAAASTAKVQADVLVGQDGVARAVRLVE